MRSDKTYVNSLTIIMVKLGILKKIVLLLSISSVQFPSPISFKMRIILVLLGN